MSELGCCEDCELWKSVGGEIGLCAEREEYTSDDDWCGEFKQKESK